MNKRRVGNKVEVKGSGGNQEGRKRRGMEGREGMGRGDGERREWQGDWKGGDWEGRGVERREGVGSVGRGEGEEKEGLKE